MKKDNSIFLPSENREKHIVDQLLLERCPGLSSHWTWPVFGPIVRSFMQYRRAKRIADFIAPITGQAAFSHVADELGFQTETLDFDRIPRTGSLMIAANHPTGLADGIALWDVIKDIRPDAMFFANADMLRIIPNSDDFMIPVEWVEEKRTPAKTRETLRRARAALNDGRCIIMFPSGKLAKMVDRKLTEQEWLPTVVSLARKYKAPVLPFNMKARNSPFYYWIGHVSSELRDVTLFRELLNKTRAEFIMKAGNLIAPDTLHGDIFELTEALQAFVTDTLPHDRNAIFINPTGAPLSPPQNSSSS